MPKVALYDITGSQIGDVELSDDIFGVEVNTHVMYEAVKNYLANQRQGSTRSPQWVGGGVVFAPKPRDYSYKLPKKIKRLALKSALSSKVQDNEIIVVDSLVLDKPKTKDMVRVLSNLKAGKKTLVVIPERDENVILASRNIPGVKTAYVNTINVYDILNCDSFLITRDAVNKVEEVYA